MKTGVRILFLAVVSLAISFVFCLTAMAQAQEGEWEDTVQMKMEGMPVSIPPTTSRHCLTKDNLVPDVSTSQGKSTCQTKDQKVTGNKVTWVMECVEKGQKSHMEGEIIYSGDSYQGSMKVTTTDKSGRTMAMSGTMKGRRIGACTDSSKQAYQVGGQTYQVDQNEIKAKLDQGRGAMAEMDKQKADAERERKEQKAHWDTFNTVQVPEEDPGSCAWDGRSLPAACKTKLGKINLQPGQWEITTQDGFIRTFRDTVSDVGVKDAEKYTQCITEQQPMVSQIAGYSTDEFPGSWKFKISPQKTTWYDAEPINTKDSKRYQKGGIVFKGDTLEGAYTETTETASSKQISRTNVTGRRLGDCVQRRAYTATGRDYTSKKRQTAPEATPNPVKKVRKMLPF